MDVYWLEQTNGDVPQKNDWLSASELAFLDGLRFAKRRVDWRLGRWTAKHALALYLNLPDFPPALAKIEVRPAPSGAPEVFFENKLATATISLSHRNDRAICAVAPPAAELGCDLELIEPHSDAFVADYFTAEEQALVARQSATDRPRILAVLWSGKESALKALRAGLRMDTRCVTVELADASIDSNGGVNGWSPLQVSDTDGRIFHGWWEDANHMVRTVIAAPPPGLPIPLKVIARVPAARPVIPDPNC